MVIAGLSSVSLCLCVLPLIFMRRPLRTLGYKEVNCADMSCADVKADIWYDVVLSHFPCEINGSVNREHVKSWPVTAMVVLWQRCSHPVSWTERVSNIPINYSRGRYGSPAKLIQRHLLTSSSGEPDVHTERWGRRSELPSDPTNRS